MNKKTSGQSEGFKYIFIKKLMTICIVMIMLVMIAR